LAAETIIFSKTGTTPLQISFPAAFAILLNADLQTGDGGVSDDLVVSLRV